MIRLLQLTDYNDLFHAILNIHLCGGEINIDIAALCTGYCNSCLKFNDIQCPNITPIKYGNDQPVVPPGRLLIIADSTHSTGEMIPLSGCPRLMIGNTSVSRLNNSSVSSR